MADGLKLGTSDFALLASPAGTDRIPITRPGDKTYEVEAANIMPDLSTPWQEATVTHSSAPNLLWTIDYRRNKLGMIEISFYNLNLPSTYSDYSISNFIGMPSIIVPKTPIVYTIPIVVAENEGHGVLRWGMNGVQVEVNVSTDWYGGYFTFYNG